MGTLGQYLQNARRAKDIDIRDAAQQTRISINYLKALEEEDFSKLPGEVFIRGFLKNYARFLNLDEAETLKKYAELKPVSSPATGPKTSGTEKQAAPSDGKSQSKEETPIEPFVWGAAIFISLLVFLFTSLPVKHLKKGYQQSEKEFVPIPSALPQEASQSSSAKPDKLYLEVIALEDTWLLIRTDTSPQKKAVLKKGESLIWSADERFLLSYGRASDLKLLLNGEELTVRGTGQTPIRDLAVTRTGIMNQPLPVKQPQPMRPKPKLAVQPLQPQPSTEAQTVQSAAPAAPPAPAAVPLPSAEPVPAPAPAQLPPQTQ